MNDHIGIVVMDGGEPIVAADLVHDGIGPTKILVRRQTAQWKTGWQTFYESFNYAEAREVFRRLVDRSKAAFTTTESQTSASTKD